MPSDRAGGTSGAVPARSPSPRHPDPPAPVGFAAGFPSSAQQLGCDRVFHQESEGSGRRELCRAFPAAMSLLASRTRRTRPCPALTFSAFPPPAVPCSCLLLSQTISCTEKKMYFTVFYTP